MHFLQHLLALGDIGGDARHPVCLAGIVEDRKSANVYPADVAIGADDAKLVVEFRILKFVEVRERFVQIVGMNRINPRLRIGIQAVAGPSPDFFIGGTDIVNLRAVEILQKENVVDVFRYLAETQLAGA
ncbi:MAG: hypothetical protein P4L92_14055, partial [Rudaea sp.]|nr:hypothetical protein [Rudaea sp.]